jgi:hypothetical protein
MGVGDQRHSPAGLPPGGWVGPRAGLDGCWKFRSLPGSDPRTVQLVASRYTDWAIAALSGPVEIRKQNVEFRATSIPSFISPPLFFVRKYKLSIDFCVYMKKVLVCFWIEALFRRPARTLHSVPHTFHRMLVKNGKVFKCEDLWTA